MFCSYCKKEIPDSQSFCPYCGKTGNTKITTAQKSQAKPANNKRKSKLPIIIMALILVLIIIAGVIFAPKLFKDKTASSDGTADQTAVTRETESVWVLKEAVTTSGTLTIRCSYNENGELIEHIETTTDGATTSTVRIIYEYDKNSQKTKETKYKNDSEISSILYEYNNKGECIKETKDNGASVYTYKYDANGNLIETAFNGTVSDKYEYDSENRLVKEYEIDRGVDTDYTYDENGNLLEKYLTYDHGGHTIYSYEYDENGNKTKSYWNNLLNLSYEYDENGNQTVIKNHMDSEESCHKIAYDENGRRISKKTYIKDDFHHELTYQYDENGNTIKVLYSDKNNDVKAEFILTYTLIEAEKGKVDALMKNATSAVSTFVNSVD